MSNSAGGRGSRGVSRVSIPDIAWETIQNIKEIAGNHSDEEVYAVLRECSMDPNETAQKLLFQDTFHEVKRKRDKRKVNVSVKELVNATWRSGIQGRGGRSGRGNYSSHYVSHDTSGVKNSSAYREIVADQCPDRTKTSIPQITEKKSPLASNSISGISNVPSEFTHVASFHGGTSSQNLTTETNNFQSSSSLENISIKSDQTADTYGACAPNLYQSSSFFTTTSESGAYSSVTDPVVESSLDLCSTGVVGTQKTDVEPTSNKAISCGTSSNDLSASLSDRRTLDAISLKTHSHENPSDISQTYESNNYPAESCAWPTSFSTSSGRPPSNYSNRSQQLIGSQKVTALSNQASEETTSMLQKRLDQHFSDDQYVFFPFHIQVPESERALLSFGSFTTSIVVNSNNELGNKKCSPPCSESSQKLKENVEEYSSSIENDSPTTQEDDIYPQSPENSPENLSSDEVEISNPSAGQDRGSALPSVEPQYSVIQTTPTYSTIGLIPLTVESAFTKFESSESQAHDTPRPSGIVVQQPFDPSVNYHTQVYHTGAEGDACYSPFCPTGATMKHTTALSSQTDLSQQEGGNSFIQPSSGPPIVAETAGWMQNSIPVTQQPLPVFQQPAGVHISHYPSNYIPYGPYFSPFCLPPHSVHPYASNAAFPPQHPTAPIYSPMAAASAPIKFPVSQLKTGTNSTHSTHVGMSAGYGTYNSSLTGYSPNPAPNTVNSASNEHLAVSQYKENNMYLSGRQSDGSTVWIPAPGRDVFGLQANSFYNLPPQGHVTFTPTQAGHGAFPGIFHLTQMASTTVHPLLHQSQTVAGAVEMMGHQAGVYPQPQCPPINWANNY